MRRPRAILRHALLQSRALAAAVAMAAPLAAWPVSTSEACGPCVCRDDPGGWPVAIWGTLPRNACLLIAAPEFAGIATLRADDGSDVENELEPSGVPGRAVVRVNLLR
jgi:hypothetical protein